MSPESSGKFLMMRLTLLAGLLAASERFGARAVPGVPDLPGRHERERVTGPGLSADLTRPVGGQ